MKVLVLSPYGIGKSRGGKGYHGAGWIGAFLRAMREFSPDVRLGVAFDERQQQGMQWGQDIEEIKAYPLRVFQSRMARWKKLLNFDYESNGLIPEIQKAIDDFKPDVIQVFGSETAVGVVCGVTDVPVAVHIQGFLPSYENAKYPPGISAKEDLPAFWRHPLWHFWRKHLVQIYHWRAEREALFLSRCQMVFGRTHWDKAIARLYAPQAQYHYVSEVLREEFYENAGCWKTYDHKDGSPFTIVSVISLPLFKGQDVILKTAQMLTRYTSLSFQWKIYGLEWGLKRTERRTGINVLENHVESCGIATARQLIEALKNADVFVLPSYIENSPNSLCEAQMLGLPCVATNVGGVASLIQNGENGLLVPANDPLMMADAIQQICLDDVLARNLGENATITALKRHDRKQIVHDALDGYQAMLNQKM